MSKELQNLSRKIQYIKNDFLFKENIIAVYMDINDLSDEEFQICYSFMSDEKKHRIDKLRQRSDRIRSVTGDYLMRYLVSQKSGISPESVQIYTEQSGRPGINNSELKVSLSHSGDYVVCACATRNVGVDIEQITQYDDDVATVSCTENEMRYIDKNDDKAACFTLLWTLKEAHCKCVGTENFTGPQDVEMSDGEVLFDRINGVKNICIDDFTGYACSLSVEEGS